MVTSLNGWVGIPTSGPALATAVVPGTTRTVTLARNVLPLFLAYLHDWHLTVMPLDGSPTYLGPDGWVYRVSRTGAGLSCHASGTAVDVRYDVLKADHQRHMTATQIAAVHRLLDKYSDATGRRVFGWGGDWTVGTYCDEMHTELAQSWAVGAQGRATVAVDVAQVIARLRIRPDGTVAPTVPPAPPYPGKPIGWGSSGPAVAAVQRSLQVTVSSVFDTATRNAVARWTLTHPAAALRDRVGIGAVGPALYASILTRYPA